MALSSQQTDSLGGVLERIIFYNEENSYCIAELRLPGKGKSVTITGTLPGVQCGETLRLEGEWIRHPQHGEQFKARSFRSELPSDVYGIRKYLGSGLVHGIGPVYADKIVDQFGADTFRIISEESARLREVPGIGKTRALSIKKAWDEQKSVREVMVFLQTYGVTSNQCLRIVRKYGQEAPALLKKEPYRVAREIDGIGFKTADRIAINIGFANDSPPRLEAGLLFSMDELESEGHTAIPADRLLDYASELLAASRDLLAARLDALIAAKALVRVSETGEDIVQLPRTERTEKKIAESVLRISRASSALPPIKVDIALQWAQDREGIAFSPEQTAAVKQALESKYTIITGGPGTGKTTILRALVAILTAKKARVLMAAPTGRAAQRLAETTGGYAQTIHRLLKFDPSKGGFVINEDQPLKADVVIVDEASMLDTFLAASLLQAVPPRAHLVLVGDTDQLPSVGPGSVLHDLIEGSPAGVIRLSRIYRQNRESLIVVTAHSINEGRRSPPTPVEYPAQTDPGRDLHFIRAESPEDCLAKIKTLCTETVPRGLGADPLVDCQVLSPMHKGVAGVANINLELQELLNGRSPGTRTVSGFYRRGDKVIQLRNNYDKNVFNGEVGIITAIDEINGSLEVEFEGTRHPYQRGEIGDLSLAYAISIHKSQGSEYPVVVIPLLKQHYMMLQRNLLYTAITRGKSKVFLVGDPVAYAMAVGNAETKARYTRLKEAIAGLGH